jgi:hypothetical protein
MLADSIYLTHRGYVPHSQLIELQTDPLRWRLVIAAVERVE